MLVLWVLRDALSTEGERCHRDCNTFLYAWFLQERNKEAFMMELKVTPVETDVLIIGGGLAGCMAAIHAAERGDLKVTLVDKSNTMASGSGAFGRPAGCKMCPKTS